ncbi:MAG: acylphosphatase [Pseudomonadota bacterium]|nr:acylphosphatase [Pseudomonadota bacterium]
MIARRYRVSGRVQGVSFRAWLQDEARHAGLAGWCRNRPDGSVETVICGGEDDVAAMAARLQQGPSHAKVEQVEDLGETDLVDGDFEIRPTG